MLRSLLVLLLLATILPTQAACPSSTPSAEFTDHGDGTITLTRSGLTWQRCALGQTWDGSTCTGTATTFTWSEALQAAAANTFAGHDDWRLASFKELYSLAIPNCGLNPSFFPNGSAAVWSSTSSASNPLRAWANGFSGTTLGGLKTALYAARLVRGGRGFAAFDRQAQFAPTPFAFVSQSGVATGSTVTSAAVTLAGLSTATGIQVGNGSYAINGGSYETAPGVVNNGDVITLRHSAAASAGSSVTTTVTIGGLSGAFVSTTAVPAPPPPTQPINEVLLSSASTVDVGGSLPVRIGSSANGATLNFTSAGNQTLTLNGVDLAAQVTVGSVLTVKQISADGPPQLVLALGQGQLGLTAKAAGQPLLAFGDTVLQARSAGTVIGASPGQVAVGSGSLTLSGAPAGLKDGVLYAGEVARFNASGKIVSVRLGSADGSGALPGDPLPLAAAIGQSAGFSSDALVPRLDGPVARLPDGLEQGIATALGGSGKQNASGVLALAGQPARSFLPLGEIGIDNGLADGVSTTADGLTRTVSNGVVVTLAPALRDLGQFARDLAQAVPGATLTLRDGGVLLASLAGRDYVVRSAAESEAVSGDDHATAFAGGSDGVLRYRDGLGGQQALYPAFLNYPATLVLLDSLASGSKSTTSADGSIAVQLGADRFILIPDLALTPLNAESVTHVLSGQKWWLGSDGRVYLNGSGGVQGVTVK
jgi:hypothetical protein